MPGKQTMLTVTALRAGPAPATCAPRRRSSRMSCSDSRERACPDHRSVEHDVDAAIVGPDGDGAPRQGRSEPRLLITGQQQPPVGLGMEVGLYVYDTSGSVSSANGAGRRLMVVSPAALVSPEAGILGSVIGGPLLAILLIGVVSR
jgi:hypothetical protein